MGISREASLYYYWKVTDCLAGYFTRIFPNSLHYIWTFTNLFAGVFLKFFYTPSLLLESCKLFVGVFLKKFRKFSHLAYFGVFVLPIRKLMCKPHIFLQKKKLDRNQTSFLKIKLQIAIENHNCALGFLLQIGSKDSFKKQNFVYSFLH